MKARHQGKKSKCISLKDVHQTWKWFEDVGWIESNIYTVKHYDNINKSITIPIIVIGSSPAAKGLDLSALKKAQQKGKIKILVVNHVIETIPFADFLMFQDMRFLRENKFDLESFKGAIFASNTNPYGRKENKPNVFYFKPIQNSKNVSTDINRGLYTRKSTGVCALNLALIMSTSRVYMVGLDNSKSYYENYTESQDVHLNSDYSGPNNKKALDSYIYINNVLYEKFSLYAPRILNVCKDGFLDYFGKISMEDFNSFLKAD